MKFSDLQKDQIEQIATLADTTPGYLKLIKTGHANPSVEMADAIKRAIKNLGWDIDCSNIRKPAPRRRSTRRNNKRTN